MSNEILVGNTPIFDQLVREMEERGKRYNDMIADGPVDLRPVSSFFKRPIRMEGVRPLYQIVDEMDKVAEFYSNPLTSIGEDDDNGMHTIGATDDSPSFMPSVKRLGWLSEGLQEPA